MGKIFAILGVILYAAVIVFLVAVVSGTVLYFVWPYAIPFVFPRLAEDGYLSKTLTWFQSVCLSWVFGVLIKPSITNKSKEKGD